MKQTMALDASRRSPLKIQRAHTGGEDEDRKVCGQKRPDQGSTDTPLSLSIASYHEAYVVVVMSFLVEELNHQVKKYGILAEITKFNSCQNFLLCCTYTDAHT